jgi:hypothetical protein
MPKDDERQFDARLGDEKRAKGKRQDMRIQQKAAAQQHIARHERRARRPKTEIERIGDTFQCGREVSG